MTTLHAIQGAGGFFSAVLLDLPIPLHAVRLALRLAPEAKMSAALSERWGCLCLCSKDFERYWRARDEKPRGVFFSVLGNGQ